MMWNIFLLSVERNNEISQGSPKILSSKSNLPLNTELPIFYIEPATTLFPQLAFPKVHNLFHFQTNFENRNKKLESRSSHITQVTYFYNCYPEISYIPRTPDTALNQLYSHSYRTEANNQTTEEQFMRIIKNTPCTKDTTETIKVSHISSNMNEVIRVVLKSFYRELLYA